MQNRLGNGKAARVKSLSQNLLMLRDGIRSEGAIVLAAMHLPPDLVP